MKTKNYFYVIPLIMLEIIIQLLFFWLAPANACRWVIYTFLTTSTAIHFTLIFLLGSKKGARRSMPTIICGTMIILLLMGMGIVMLSTNATFRNAMFLMLILFILYVAVVSLMIFSMEPDDAAPEIPVPPQKLDDDSYVYARKATPMPNHMSYQYTKKAWSVPETSSRSNRGSRDGKHTPPLPIRR